jgi:hypothetical protein
MRRYRREVIKDINTQPIIFRFFERNGNQLYKCIRTPYEDILKQHLFESSAACFLDKSV